MFWRQDGFNSSRTHLERFVKRAAASVPNNSLVLDAGAGSGLYAPLFDQMTYESADFGAVDKPYAKQTYVCDLAAIPVEDERYDLVLMTQVLEHLRDPLAVLKELRRILKSGSRLWMTQPFYYEEHEQPYDFYRYTQFGLRHLLESSQLKVVEMFWLEGYAGTLSYQLAMGSRSLPRNPAAYGGGAVGVAASALSLLVRPSFGLLSRIYSRLDDRHRHTASGHCKNYCVIAEKA